MHRRATPAAGRHPPRGGRIVIMAAMWTAGTVEQLRTERSAMKGSVAFVPTMGALHRGHLALVHAARQAADHIIVSIFVNPAQFAPDEDYESYPRQIEADLAACREAAVDGVFCPPVEQVYPPSIPECTINVPSMAHVLEGEIRPTHFAGVCRVVAKLLNMVRPDVAVFGQKDYQQLKIIEAMVADLAMPVRIVGMPTCREEDGLAMSSRNAYLDTPQRQHARGLYKALLEAKRLVEEDGETDPEAVETAMEQVMMAHHVEPQYAVIRHPHTLAELDCIEPALTGGVVALIAGHLGETRLIDNMLLAEAG